MTAKHLLYLSALMAALQPAFAATADCRAAFGEIVDMDQCQTATLPHFDVQFTGTSQPNDGIPLLCWNYRITANKTGATVEVSQCHTGALGGERDFVLDGKPYTVLFDLSKGCRRSEQGHWSPQQRGHAFLPGTRDSKAAHALRDKMDKAESACYQRDTKSGQADSEGWRRQRQSTASLE